MILHQLPSPPTTFVRRALGARGWNPALYVNLRDVMTMVAAHADQSTMAAQDVAAAGRTDVARCAEADHVALD
jgi:hypothetical protein